MSHANEPSHSLDRLEQLANARHIRDGDSARPPTSTNPFKGEWLPDMERDRLTHQKHAR
jgi:hypothetical protein